MAKQSIDHSLSLNRRPSDVGVGAVPGDILPTSPARKHVHCGLLEEHKGDGGK